MQLSRRKFLMISASSAFAGCGGSDEFKPFDIPVNELRGYKRMSFGFPFPSDHSSLQSLRHGPVYIARTSDDLAILDKFVIRIADVPHLRDLPIDFGSHILVNFSISTKTGCENFEVIRINRDRDLTMITLRSSYYTGHCIQEIGEGHYFILIPRIMWGGTPFRLELQRKPAHE